MLYCICNCIQLKLITGAKNYHRIDENCVRSAHQFSKFDLVAVNPVLKINLLWNKCMYFVLLLNSVNVKLNLMNFQESFEIQPHTSLYLSIYRLSSLKYLNLFLIA